MSNITLRTSDLTQLKKLIKSAKSQYYDTGKTLRIDTSTLPENLAALVLHGRIVRGRISWPSMDTDIHDKKVEVTDSVYDMLEQALREYEPDSPVLKQVRVESVKQVEVKLPYLMPSLDKKLQGDGSLEKWMTKNPGPYIIMDKLDGVSMELLWDGGNFTKLYKGGSATHGMDWSHAIPHLKLPRKAPSGAGGVRAELIMSKSEFNKLWADKYKNARNLTSGIVNKTRGMHEAVGSIQPIVFDVLHKRLAPSKALANAAQLGFKVVHHIKATRLTEDKLQTYLRTREKADHMIDGLVIAVDKPFALTEANPKSVIAWKAPSEGNYAETSITEVEWRVSRHGVLIPRFTVEPVKLAGVTVKHATAHNAAYVFSEKLNVGSIVAVRRSGEVIPYVEKVIKPSRTASMPDSSVVGAYGWDANKTHLVLKNAGGSSVGQVKAIAHFFQSGLEVDDMGEGVVKQLYEAGYTTVGKIIRLKVTDYMKLPGWQQRKAEKIYNNIKTKCSNADLVKVMAGSGLFGKLIGERKLRALQTARPKLFNLNSNLSSKQIEAALQEVPGFKDKSAQPIIDNLTRVFEWLAKLPITFKKPEVVKVAGSKLAGAKVCFTGVRDAELEKLIVQQGGSIATGVASSTTHLIVKVKQSGSAKDKKAQQLMIPIYTIDEFKRHYKL